MLVFLNWSDTDTVINWWESELSKIDEIEAVEDKENRLAAAKAASPELQVLLKQFEEPFKALDGFRQTDPFNHALMAVRLTVPQKNKSAKYSLANRFPGAADAKPPVSLACKAFLSSTFPDFFLQSYKPKVENDFTFVSFKSEKDFFDLLVAACSVLDSPVPQGIEAFANIRKLQLCETQAVELVKAYTHNNRQKLEQAGNLALYENLANNYQPGISVDNSSLLLLTASHLLGIVDAPSQEPAA